MSMSTFHLTLYEPLSLQQFNFPHTINSYYTFIKYDLITTISEHTFVTYVPPMRQFAELSAITESVFRPLHHYLFTHIMYNYAAVKSIRLIIV